MRKQEVAETPRTDAAISSAAHTVTTSHKGPGAADDVGTWRLRATRMATRCLRVAVHRATCPLAWQAAVRNAQLLDAI